MQRSNNSTLRSKSSMSLSPPNENVTTCQPSMDSPPILGLPVEIRYPIYSYATDQQEWLAPESERIQPLALDRNRFGQRHFHDNSDDALFPRRKAFLITNTSDPHEPQPTCARSTARVNNHLRVELSESLRTSSMPGVSRVRDFDFSHLEHYLSTLEEVR
jgi:hypothetical protein